VVQINKRCVNCKKLYKDHIIYFLEEWSWDGATDIEEEWLKVACNRFRPMSNLDYLEWKDEQQNKR
jgi:hypothetical protein